jgi:hypothetical protein
LLVRGRKAGHRSDRPAASGENRKNGYVANDQRESRNARADHAVVATSCSDLSFAGSFS